MEMKPPAICILSNALLSTIRSLITGNGFALHGSTHNVSPSLKYLIDKRQVVTAGTGPWGWPLIYIPHEPHIPSRQSWSNATGSLSSSTSFLLSASSISRKDISGDTSSILYVAKFPFAPAFFCRHIFNVRFIILLFSRLYFNHAIFSPLCLCTVVPLHLYL